MAASFTFPVAGYGVNDITSIFGHRDTSGLPAGASKYHEGIDIAAPKGTGVLAALPGKVAYTGNSSAKGNYIIVDHGTGLQTEYAHLNSIGVRGGQNVAAGQQIGTVGSTGISSGNHLDFRMKENGTYIDPLKFSGTGSSAGVAAINELLGEKGMNNFNADNILNAIKENWLLVAGGLILIAILTK